MVIYKNPSETRNPKDFFKRRKKSKEEMIEELQQTSHANCDNHCVEFAIHILNKIK